MCIVNVTNRFRVLNIHLSQSIVDQYTALYPYHECLKGELVQGIWSMFDAKAGSKGRDFSEASAQHVLSLAASSLAATLMLLSRLAVITIIRLSIVWPMPRQDMKVKGLITLHRCLTFWRSQCRWACRSLPITLFLTSRCRVFIQFTYGPSSKFIFLPTLQCKLGLSFYLVSELTILLRIQAWTTSVSSRRDSITKLNSAVGNSSLQELLSSQAQFLFHAVVFFWQSFFFRPLPPLPLIYKKKTTTCLSRSFPSFLLYFSFPSSFLLFFLSLLFPLSLSLRLYNLYLYLCSAIVCFGNIVTRGPAHWHGPAFA